MAALLITRHDSLDIRSRPDTVSLAHGDSTSTPDTADKMTATGSGQSDFTVYVDPSSGLLLSAAGATHTKILVTTATSRFPFREEAQLTITLLR
jgi:hypothetical protein